jgi:hypothetical protein
MKKLLFLVVIGIGGSMLVKGNHVALTPEGQVRFMAWTFPLPEGVRSSPLMGMVMLFAQPQGPSASGVPSPLGVAQARPGVAPAAAPPALPVVTSAAQTYNPNPQPNPHPAASGPAAASDQFSAVAKALRPK